MARTSLLFKGGALRQLRRGAKKTAGRNNQGHITAFHRGGGAKRAHRIIDMRRAMPGLVGTVERIEYDPFRTGRTALIRWDDDGEGGDTTRPASPSRPKGAGARGAGASSEIGEWNGKMFPRSFRDLPKRELRSAVATICGVPLAVVNRNRRGLKVVKVDGREFWSCSAGIDQGMGGLLSLEVDALLPGTIEKCNNICSGNFETTLKRFSDILNI